MWEEVGLCESQQEVGSREDDVQEVVKLVDLDEVPEVLDARSVQAATGSWSRQ